jgi:hypothetical protein
MLTVLLTPTFLEKLLEPKNVASFIMGLVVLAIIIIVDSARKRRHNRAAIRAAIEARRGVIVDGAGALTFQPRLVGMSNRKVLWSATIPGGLSMFGLKSPDLVLCWRSASRRSGTVILTSRPEAARDYRANFVALEPDAWNPEGEAKSSLTLDAFGRRAEDIALLLETDVVTVFRRFIVVLPNSDRWVLEYHDGEVYIYSDFSTDGSMFTVGFEQHVRFAQLIDAALMRARTTSEAVESPVPEGVISPLVAYRRLDAFALTPATVAAIKARVGGTAKRPSVWQSETLGSAVGWAAVGFVMVLFAIRMIQEGTWHWPSLVGLVGLAFIAKLVMAIARYRRSPFWEFKLDTAAYYIQSDGAGTIEVFGWPACTKIGFKEARNKDVYVATVMEVEFGDQQLEFPHALPVEHRATPLSSELFSKLQSRYELAQAARLANRVDTLDGADLFTAEPSPTA